MQKTKTHRIMTRLATLITALALAVSALPQMKLKADEQAPQPVAGITASDVRVEFFRQATDGNGGTRIDSVNSFPGYDDDEDEEGDNMSLFVGVSFTLKNSTEEDIGEDDPVEVPVKIEVSFDGLSSCAELETDNDWTTVSVYDFAAGEKDDRFQAIRYFTITNPGTMHDAVGFVNVKATVNGTQYSADSDASASGYLPVRMVSGDLSDYTGSLEPSYSEDAGQYYAYYVEMDSVREGLTMVNNPDTIDADEDHADEIGHYQVRDRRSSDLTGDNYDLVFDGWEYISRDGETVDVAPYDEDDNNTVDLAELAADCATGGNNCLMLFAKYMPNHVVIEQDWSAVENDQYSCYLKESENEYPISLNEDGGLPYDLAHHLRVTDLNGYVYGEGDYTITGNSAVGDTPGEYSFTIKSKDTVTLQFRETITWKAVKIEGTGLELAFSAGGDTFDFDYDTMTCRPEVTATYNGTDGDIDVTGSDDFEVLWYSEPEDIPWDMENGTVYCRYRTGDCTYTCAYLGYHINPVARYEVRFDQVDYAGLISEATSNGTSIPEYSAEKYAELTKQYSRDNEFIIPRDTEGNLVEIKVPTYLYDREEGCTSFEYNPGTNEIWGNDASEPGTYTASIDPGNNGHSYTGTFRAVTLAEDTENELSISLDCNEFDYSGQPVEPGISEVLYDDEDVTDKCEIISYEDNIYAGIGHAYVRYLIGTAEYMIKEVPIYITDESSLPDPVDTTVTVATEDGKTEYEYGAVNDFVVTFSVSEDFAGDTGFNWYFETDDNNNEVISPVNQGETGNMDTQKYEITGPGTVIITVYCYSDNYEGSGSVDITVTGKRESTIGLTTSDGRTEYTYPGDDAVLVNVDMAQVFADENPIIDADISDEDVLESSGWDNGCMKFAIKGTGTATITVHCESDTYVGEDSIEITVVACPYQIIFEGTEHDYENDDWNALKDFVFSDDEFLDFGDGSFVPTFTVYEQGIKYTGTCSNIKLDGIPVTPTSESLAPGTHTLTCTCTENGKSYTVKGEFKIIRVDEDSRFIVETDREAYIENGSAIPGFSAYYSHEVGGHEDLNSKVRVQYKNNDETGTGYAYYRYEYAAGSYTYAVRSAEFTVKEELEGSECSLSCSTTNFAYPGDEEFTVSFVPSSSEYGIFDLEWSTSDTEVIDVDDNRTSGYTATFVINGTGTATITCSFDSELYYGTRTLSINVAELTMEMLDDWYTNASDTYIALGNQLTADYADRSKNEYVFDGDPRFNPKFKVYDKDGNEISYIRNDIKIDGNSLDSLSGYAPDPGTHEITVPVRYNETGYTVKGRFTMIRVDNGSYDIEAVLSDVPSSGYYIREGSDPVRPAFTVKYNNETVALNDAKLYVSYRDGNTNSGVINVRYKTGDYAYVACQASYGFKTKVDVTLRLPETITSSKNLGFYATATASVPDGDNGTYTYESSDASVLKYSETVNGKGKFTALKPGTVTITATYVSALYCGTVTKEVTVEPRPIEITDLKALDKDYDGTTNAVIDTTNKYVTGIVPGDDVQLSYSGKFRTKDAGTDKPVDITVTLSGDDAENYVVDTENSDLTVKATIDPAKVSVTGLEIKSKEYDGTTAAEVDDAYIGVDGVLEGEEVKVSYSAEYADAKIGEDKDVTLTISLSGKDAANYVIYDFNSSSKNQYADIFPARITITGLAVKEKAYDGTTGAELDYSNVKVTNIVEGEDVTLSYSAYFEDANIGTNKPVTVTVTLSGKDAGNYEINTDASGLLLYSDIYEEPETVLRIAGTEVKEGSTSASGNGWSYTETEDKAMLTLNGFTYEGEGPAILYTGGKLFEITYKGDNTITVNKAGDENTCISVYTDKGLTLSGGKDDQLYLTAEGGNYSYGIDSAGDVRITGEGTIAVDAEGCGFSVREFIMEGGMLIAYGDNCGIAAYTVKVTDGTLIANGRTEDGIFIFGEDDAAVILEGGKTVAACDLEGESIDPKGNGIWASEANIIIGEKAFLTASTRSTGPDYTAINGKVINKIKGTGWMDIDNLDSTEAIEASEAGQTLAYKGVMFPEKKKDNGSDSGESTSGGSTSGGTTGGGEGGTVNGGGSSGTGETTGGTENGKDSNGDSSDSSESSGGGGGTANEGGASGDKPGEENGTYKPGVDENKGGNGSEDTAVPENGGNSLNSGNDDSGWFWNDDVYYGGWNANDGVTKPDDGTDTSKPADQTETTKPGKDDGKAADKPDGGTGTGKDIPGWKADDGVTIPDEDDGSAEPVIQRQTTTNDTADDGTKTATTSTTYTDGSKITEKVVEKPDGSTTSTTTTTEADGTKVVEKVEEKADGSSKATTTTATTDGAKTTETIEKKVDGTEVKTQTVKDADGSSTTEKVEKKPDGTVTTTNTKKDADGASTTEKIVAKPDGSVTTTNTVKDADGNVLSTGKVIEKTKEDGTKTITATEKNADGSSSTSKTTINTDGSSKTNSTINNADGTTTKEKITEKADGSLTRTATTTDEDGNVLSVEKEKVTVSKSGTETSTTTTENADGSMSEKTVKTKADGTSSSTETSTDAEGNVTVTIGNTKKDGTSIEKAYAVDEDGLVLTGVEATTTSASIPASVKVNGKSVPVTSVGEGAMKDNKTVKTVKIPESVTSIGEDAFSGASKLKTIKLTANITEIAPGAFDGIKSNATFYISAASDKEFDALVELLKKSGVGSKVKFKRA